MDRPFMTWQHKDILLDEKDEEIKRLREALGDIVETYEKGYKPWFSILSNNMKMIAQKSTKGGGSEKENKIVINYIIIYVAIKKMA